MLDSLNRGLDIMKYIVINRCASVSEIAQVFNINKSTASRVLSILAKHDLIRKDESTLKFYSSIGSLLFSARMLVNNMIMDETHLQLRLLAESINMTAQFSILMQGNVILLDQVKSEKNKYLKEPAFPGMKEPFHCTALGKCALAYMPEEEFNDIMKDYNFVKHTENTITDIQALKEELEIIRKAGYAKDMGEYSDKVYCMAVPVYDKEGRAIFGLGVSGNKEYLENEQLFLHVLKRLQKASEQISRKYMPKDIF